MKASILTKLETLVERYEEVQHLLGDPDVIGDQDKFRALSKEYSQLEEVTKCFQAYQQAQDDLIAAEEMANEDDEEMREMAQEEIKEAKATIERLADELQILLLPKDPNDDRNCFLEIRAVRVAMKRVSSPVTCSVCTASTRRRKAGVLK
ncbi:Peptide chain release factor 1 directs the termination of translation in response to the peptide chain termination codons UAG and UAA [Vibrio sp. B1FLJ16]|nr:Peptide chain release factor 1 directs the termination of translation in response to the peptide chain termination codons UAG and UAA [Vibrio sp. B1FLJ16]CAE6890016.1 Peptide chain release factor 1 directs the termination of translation in response to the peptide chain termination codons UAG and UAA [Vibrio sp. B1FLJ16]